MIGPDVMPAYDQMWPELFVKLDQEQVASVMSTFGNDFLEGGEATRDDVELVCRVAAGELTHEEAIAQIKAEIQSRV